MKAKDIRALNDNELNSKLKDLTAELVNLLFQQATGQLDNPMRLRGVRKDIARIQTVVRERELGIRKEA